ncbi:MAG: hypothetical protein HDR00_04905 [Lachnospiraceae bacterium]|nr:hypothetical protein [Lachnospiraceae bacterium]
MITAWKERIKTKKLNNKGSAIVAVILALAFVGMLIAMLVYMVYYNYLMKYTDRAAKNNFYSAETALNEIQAGIIRDVSDALQESYSEVTKQHYDDTAVNQQVIFESLYKKNLNDNLEMMTVYMGAATGNQLKYSVDHLLSYLEEPYKSSTNLDYIGTANQGGVNVRYGNANYSDGVLILEDVRVSYTNADGYVSIIETDIAIETPELTFNSIQDVPQIENYSLIAADMITTGIGENDTIITPARVSVDGNVFGGDDGIYVNGDGYIKFVKNANDGDAVRYTLTAATINAMDGYRRNNTPPSTASVDVSDVYSVWAEDLYAESAYMKIYANCFIRDDLTLDGLYPKVELSGTYNGYGSADATAENSSAILINGAHSTLDFGGLDGLWLAGGAYVGSAHYNANETTIDYINEPLDEYYERVDEEIANNERDEDTVSRNGTDVLMGQSLAVKPDQLMYMVPVECMGYEGDVQILAKNPMTIEEYNKLFGTFAPLTENGQTVIGSDGEIQYSNQLVYTPVRLDVLMKKVGGTANSYGASYVPVFRRINGTILVYFYLDFVNQDMANKFFRDYYEADKEAFDRYFKTYVRSFTWNNSLGSNSSPLSIAGNMLYMNGGNNATVRLIEDTTIADITKSDAMYETAENYYVQYTGLSKYLMSTSAGLSAEQLKNSVFDNIIVSDSDFAKLVSDGHFKVFENTDQSLKAILVNNDGGYDPFEITDERAANCALVIARGDVIVSAREFHGLIISGGEIKIASTCQTISYDSANVKKAMILKNADGKYVFEAVVNGAAYVNVIGGDPDLANAVDESLNNGVVTADQLVKFRNWNKQ